MSGAQTSPFLTTNELLAPMAAYDTHANALLQQQEHQQAIAANNTEVVARAASTLLDPTLYPTEEARAAGWAKAIPILKANGYAPNAPDAYPGLEHLQLTARLGTPSQTQQEWGFNLAANKAYTAATATPTTPAATTTGGSTTAPAGDGLTGDKAHDLPLIVQRESGGDPTALNYVARQDPTAYARGATASGKYQIVNSTWREGMQLAGLDPAQYATAREAPEQVQDKVASAIYDKYGNRPWQKGPQDWVKDEQGRYQMATVRPAAGAPGGAPAIAPPGTLPGAPATPPPYRVASNAPVPPPASTAPAVALPRDQAVVQAQRTGQAVPVAGVDGLWALPNGNLSSTPPSTAPAVPQAQVVPQPPANRVMPGAADGPPAVTAQAPPQPAAAPASTPQPPQLAPLNAAGLTPIQQRQIDAYAADPRVPLEKRMAAQQAFANQNIQLQQKQFSDWIQLQQLQTSQGQLSVAQQNSALEAWKVAHPDAKVTLSGGEIITQDPRSGREIAPRIQVGPNAAPRTVEGPGVWDGQKWVQAKPGEQGTPGKWTIGPGGGQFFPSQEAIVEEQKHDAARLAELRKDTFEQAQGAAQTSALIGNAEQAMAAAMKGNIPPGRFGPELLGITAAAKSLGIDLSPFGVDEKALAAGQITREQLQQMNGAILRKMFPQRVTNVDLATTGAALPNYGLDPEALAANFKIYKAQADYDQNRARDMLDYEAQHSGSLVGWEHQWVQKHGFSNGPLDNLFSDAKAGNLSKGAATTSSQPQYREGQTATGQNGAKLIFRNGNWVSM